MQVLYLLFVMAAHIVGFGLMIGAMTGPHNTCKIEYKVVAAILYLLMTIPRNLGANYIPYLICKFFSRIA